MKTLAFAALLLVADLAAARKQAPVSPPESTAAPTAKSDSGRIRALRSEIRASLQEQKDAFKELYAQEKNAVGAVGGATMAPEEKRAAVRQLRSNYEAKRAAIRAELKAGRDARRAEIKAALQSVQAADEEPPPSP